MKLYALLVFAAILAAGWRTPASAADPYRDIERAELARTYDAGLAALLDGPPALGARAALAIGRTKDAAAAPVLRERLATSVPGVRAMCAYALGLLADPGALPALRGLARNDKNSAVRYAAIDAVGRIVLARPRTATQAVANDTIIVARTDADPVVRAHAAAQLDAFHDPAIAKKLAPSLQRALMREAVEDVRWHLAWAIFRGYAKAVNAAFLARALHDRNELVRVEAARAWGRRSDARAGAIVKTALDDPSWRVQYEAREALRRIAKLPPTDHLIAAPPGLHLPPVPPVAAAAAHAGPPSATGAAKPGPPDPATLPLAQPVLAERASDLNAPAAGPHPRVLIATGKGDIVVRLYPEWAPSTVANFLALAGRRYFDGNRWFRIVPDFVVQTGDPNDNGTGDAGYMIPAEENPVEQRSGIIAMGLNYDINGAQRDSAGTQFYITLSPQLHLDRDFSVFGEVASGFDVLAHLIESDRMLAVTRISDG
ncbi:MAG: hypothetical protein NVS3B16_07130 [Vulcanimicrobiaceae bacterium]